MITMQISNTITILYVIFKRVNFQKLPGKYDFEKYFRKHLNQHNLEKMLSKILQTVCTS